MRYRLELVLKPAEGALVRVIGMTERRGFRPCAIHGVTTADSGHWHVRLDVDSARPPETLRLQLQKVYDCESVEIAALETVEAAA
ncbi:ACT domain-containing protein [Xanthomonas maliensis]|uniref:ACT domain-containing protein n=1 Tax=Xanthomonas maliensis TaxID=1321368 RepID=UPI00039EB161|nr:ACT domain-containing protein [Xanthomonas maliensis]KAB7764437.1 acetolactate synthase [Xanthomonas maliensis]